ncbi:MAG: PDZ domain-containing protein [Bryobacteraceae bacterium]
MKSQVSLAACLAAGSLWVYPLFAQRAPAAREHRTIELQTRRSGSYIGLGVAEIDAERAKALKLPDERGVEVKNVTENGPAAKAGMQVGDVVLTYNTQRVEGLEQFMRLVRETPVGRQANLTVWRNGATQSVSVTIGSRPGPFGPEGEFKTFRFEIPEIPPIPPIPDIPRANMSWRNAAMGIETESLNAQLAQFFGVKEGVLVRSVNKDSAAERAGIKAGDVIVKVENTTVTSAREISSLLRRAREDRRTAIPVVLVRERKEMSITVNLPDDRPSPKRTRAESVHRETV